LEKAARNGAFSFQQLRATLIAKAAGPQLLAIAAAGIERKCSRRFKHRIALQLDNAINAVTVCLTASAE